MRRPRTINPYLSLSDSSPHVSSLHLSISPLSPHHPSSLGALLRLELRVFLQWSTADGLKPKCSARRAETSQRCSEAWPERRSILNLGARKRASTSRYWAERKGVLTVRCRASTVLCGCRPRRHNTRRSQGGSAGSRVTVKLHRRREEAHCDSSWPEHPPSERQSARLESGAADRRSGPGGGSRGLGGPKSRRARSCAVGRKWRPLGLKRRRRSFCARSDPKDLIEDILRAPNCIYIRRFCAR